MSPRESEEGLLELENIQDAPKYPLFSNGPMIPLEVEFKIWRFIPSSKFVRLVLDENTSVEEASKKAFLDTFGCLPTDFGVFIRRKDSSAFSAIANVDGKVKDIVKEDDILVLLDSLKGHRMRIRICALIWLATSIAVIVGLCIFLYLVFILKGHFNL